MNMVGEQVMQRRQLEGGGAQFFLTQIYLNIFPLPVCLFFRLFPIFKYLVQFHVPVQVQFRMHLLTNKPPKMSSLWIKEFVYTEY